VVGGTETIKNRGREAREGSQHVSVKGVIFDKQR